MGGIDFHYPAQSLALVYGNVSFQALRPCVAAYRTRALGTIVRPATSTMGSPVPADTPEREPLARIRTPQSFETERSAFESRAMAVAGKSGNGVPAGLSRPLHVAVDG